jgi:hypothetical protein
MVCRVKIGSYDNLFAPGFFCYFLFTLVDESTSLYDSIQIEGFE